MNEETRGHIRATLTELCYAERNGEDVELVVYERLMAPLEQRIADLEAQLAEARRWTPVEDGYSYNCQCSDCQDEGWGWGLHACRDELSIIQEDDSDGFYVYLPDNIRLCRLEVSDE